MTGGGELAYNKETPRRIKRRAKKSVAIVTAVQVRTCALDWPAIVRPAFIRKRCNWLTSVGFLLLAHRVQA